MESTKLKVVHHAAEHGMTSIESGVHAGQYGSEEHYYTDIEQQKQSKGAVPTTKSISYGNESLRQKMRNSIEESSGGPVYSNDKIGTNDVIIQTLPDEEYNVIGIEPNKTFADNIYDSLKHDRRPGNCEYSHTSDLK